MDKPEKPIQHFFSFTHGRWYSAGEMDPYLDWCEQTIDRLDDELEDANQKISDLSDKINRIHGEEML